MNEGRRKISIGQILIEYRTILILAALVVVFTILREKFVDPTNLLNMIKRMSPVAIVAFGMTFIITLGGLDLSVGSIAAMTGVGLAWLTTHGVPFGLAMIIVVIVATFFGFLNGFISVKGNIAPFLVTLATMNIYRGMTMMLTDGKTVQIRMQWFTDLFGNARIWDVIPTPVIITIIFFVIWWFLFRKTKFGFYCRCIGGNEEAAKVAGINVDKVKLAAYTLNGFLACISGFILAALMNSGIPSIGTDLALDAISAVVLGGTAIAGGIGTVWGTLAGALIMAVLNAGFSLLGAQTDEQIFVKGIVIIVAVLMDNAIKARAKTRKD